MVCTHVDDAMASEMAQERQELGRSPSLVASQAEEKRVLEDLHKGGVSTVLLEGKIMGGMEGGIVRG